MLRKLFVPLVAVSLVLSFATSSNAKSPTKGAICSAKGKKAPAVSGRQLQCLKSGSKYSWVLVSQTGYSSSDLSYLRSVLKNLIDDQAETDCRMQDGIAVDGSMSLMAEDYRRLDENAPIPPGIKSVNWNPLLKVNYSFLSDAVDMWIYGDEMSASARFYVVTKHSKKILSSANKSLGTNYAFYTKSYC